MMTEQEYDQLEKILVDFIEESRREEKEWRKEEKELRARFGLPPNPREGLKLRNYRNKRRIEDEN